MSDSAPMTITGNNDDVTVLMTGAGAPGARGIIRSLRATNERTIRIVGVDMDPDAYGFELVESYHTVPAGNDPEYLSRIAELCVLESVDVVLPLTTEELKPLALGRDVIPANVMVSNIEALECANDKGKLYRFLSQNGYDSAPKFQRVNTKTAFVDAVESLGYPDETVCFKPPVGSGMRGFRVLNTESDRLTQLLGEKPGAAITTLEEVLPILSSSDTFPELIVMEYLPGDEYSVDVLAMGDSVGPVIPRIRSRTRAGITFQGVVEENEKLIEEATSICRDLGLEYNVNLQFKYTEDQVPKIIEINPRVSGTIVMCVGAGVNLPYLGVKYALGEHIPPVNIRWGTWMARYWNEVFRTPDGRTFHVDSEPIELRPRQQ